MGGPHHGNVEGVSCNGTAELTGNVKNEAKGLANGAVAEAHGQLVGYESRITEEVPNGGAAARAQQGEEQKQQPGPIISWERFLPVKTLKILLVENDDSTRQVVCALLQNCNYEVVTAANGLQAWRILEDLTNHIDLVLTEVSMPCFSGIGLLSKIMNHKTCKNIPVIMMSSNDSMGTVFKCLSKGAVDFLVKPIRKNELKNLWQHVWRRCHSSSGSGSESGIQTQKCTKSKSGDESDNNSESNDDEDDDFISIGVNARDGSDNGSGTQSLWTKRAVEIDSPEPPSPADQSADPPDSICALVIHPNPETYCNGWLPMASSKNCRKQKGDHDDFMGKDLEIGVPRNADIKEGPVKPSKIDLDQLLAGSDLKNEALTENNSSNTFEEPTARAADLIGSIAKADTHQPTGVAKTPNDFSKIADANNMNTGEMPSLELSLKRLRSSGDGPSTTLDERNVIRRSDLSAFTRYHMSAASSRNPAVCSGSCSKFDNSSDALKTDSTCNMNCNSNGKQVKQGTNSSSNINDKGSTTKNAFAKPVPNKEKVSSPSAAKSAVQQHPSPTFYPVQFRVATSGAAATPMQVKGEEQAAPAATKSGDIKRQVQVNYHHHHYHHYHHHVHSMQQQEEQSSADHKLSVTNQATVGPQTGSLKILPGPVEGQAANFSVNGSNSGSNHGSNGQNGSTTATNTRGVKSDNGNSVVGKGSTGAGNVSGSGSAMYTIRLAQREAALNKFRQKRKERNFGKKVRYQSRKRLAEQRPRVRGQFVRQPSHNEPIGRDTSER